MSKKKLFRRHPWDRWFQRKRITLRHKQDFWCQVHTMTIQIRNAARLRDLQVSLSVREPIIIVTIYGKKERNNAKGTTA